MTRESRRRTAVVLPLVLAVLAGGGTAVAVARAGATASQSVGPVATFGAQPQLPNGPVQSGPLVLTYSVNSDTAPRDFVLRNTGSLTITSQTWNVSVVNTGGGSKGNGELRFCTTLLGSCTIYEVLPFMTVPEGMPGTVTTNMTVAPGATINVRFTPASGLRQHITTIGVSVSRSQTSPAPRSSAA